MNKLRIYENSVLRREHVLGDAPVCIGAAPHCDIRVDDPGLATHPWIVVARSGSVFFYEEGEGPREARPLPLEQPLALGRQHQIVRSVERGAAFNSDTRTESLTLVRPGQAHLSLSIGRNREARRVAIGSRPLTVGTQETCDVVLWDRAVSARHCRFEPADSCVLVRDLGSRNGTYLDGVRIERAHVYEGSRLRIGRTDLCVVARGISKASAGSTSIIAQSPRMQEVLAQTRRCAALSWPVLLFGESGCGKEVVARALHGQSSRARKPLVALNAGGLPRELVESELFGHERGAFTGAATAHKGVFEQAQGGTLFLDEIGELPLDLQARLLRVLENWEVRRVGGETTFSVDVRLICATHRDLKAMVAKGSFRADLYYRLARLVIDIPPLRERPEDIMPLSEHFLASVVQEVGPRVLSDAARTCLLSHPWPGNVRELRNILGAAAAETPSMRVEVWDVERALQRLSRVASTAEMGPDALRRVVQAHRGNQSAAARALGIPRSTLRDRLALSAYGAGDRVDASPPSPGR